MKRCADISFGSSTYSTSLDCTFGVSWGTTLLILIIGACAVALGFIILVIRAKRRQESFRRTFGNQQNNTGGGFTVTTTHPKPYVPAATANYAAQPVAATIVPTAHVVTAVPVQTIPGKVHAHEYL